ncbi:hedgehog signaling/DD-peptidase zinc-binding domain protein [Vibrio phage 1.054.O._10N.261.52.A1]|nr:hedgehog signaling/DD-peptidase zinc-binding domain protein [Vibrio phage 1.054.O._10N.261.52.A1]
MKASQIKHWPSNMQPNEWPTGTLDHMDADLFTDCVFPLRKISGVPMTPSSLFGAHVRHDDSGSRHSTKEETRLADATDLQVSSIGRMIAVMLAAEQIPAIGGIGIYFDTNKPMIHVDKRPNRLVWLCYKEDGKRVYLYRENDPIKFYKKLGDLL